MWAATDIHRPGARESGGMSRRTPTILAVLALCSPLGLAGCAVSRPTKAQYTVKAGAVCHTASAESAPLIERLASVGKSLKPGGQTAATRTLTGVLQELHAAASSSLAELRALEQPAAGHAAIARFLTPFATVVGALGQAQAAAGAGKPKQALAQLEQTATASAQMTAAAKAYGMTQCETVLPALSSTAATLASAFAASEVHRAPPPPPTPTLELGSHGAAVLALQQELERLSYLPVGTADGVFDERTWHAVVAFQGWSGIERDGVVGPQTRAALAHAQRPTPWSTVWTTE